MAQVEANDVGWAFHDDAFSRVKFCGNVTEVTTFEKKPRAPDIKRLDKDHYEVGSTGEVREFEHHETRGGNPREVKRSYSKMRDLVNANVLDGEQIRMITLTYRENMTDCKRLYHDFEHFWKRWQRYSQNHDIAPCEYISIPEPQLRGAWHMHSLLIWPRAAPKFIDFKDVGALWGHGWVDQRLGDGYVTADNIGAYLTAYFENVPADQLELAELMSGKIEIVDKTYYVDGVEVTKKFAKGLRIGLYPAGFQIFRHSKGCKKPIVKDMPYKTAKEKAGARTPTFSKCWDVKADDGTVVNHIQKTWYNRKRTNGGFTL